LYLVLLYYFTNHKDAYFSDGCQYAVFWRTDALKSLNLTRIIFTGSARTAQ